MSSVSKMSDEEEKKEKEGDIVMMNDSKISRRGIDVIREKMKEWFFYPYYYQDFNEYESPELFRLGRSYLRLSNYYGNCLKYSSHEFYNEPVMVGNVKPCSYSYLQSITDNFDSGSFIQKTNSGRLFRGTIREQGSEIRSLIVKTWDFIMPMSRTYNHLPFGFCDEIEFLTNEKANTHPNLVKLHTFCYEKRLAVVFDQEYSLVLSDVILDDDWGWEDRIYVATQLADLWTWLHQKGIAIGFVSPSWIMIDKERIIKVFDFGYVSNHVNEDSKIQIGYAHLNTVPYDKTEGMKTMKYDVFLFSVILMELISKKRFFDSYGDCYDWRRSVKNLARHGKNLLVHESFKEVNSQTASHITDLIYSCMEKDQDKRPKMMDVCKALRIIKDLHIA